MVQALSCKFYCSQCL